LALSIPVSGKIREHGSGDGPAKDAGHRLRDCYAVLGFHRSPEDAPDLVLKRHCAIFALGD
jgi:hypothetical protein